MVFNKSDGVVVVVDNFYSAATGGQDVMSSRADNATKATKNPISKAVKGVGVNWVRQIDRTYDVPKLRDTLREALTTKTPGPKVIVASSRMHAEQAAPRKTADKPPRSRKAVGSKHHVLASMRPSAPAITPACGCQAARRCGLKHTGRSAAR